MRLLLDTDVWLWLQSKPRRVGESVLSTLQDRQNELLLSAASAWEIAIKYAIGRLDLPTPPSEYVSSRMRASGTNALPIEHAHALHVSTLPIHHTDPFDRLLVAQAQLERTVLVTADTKLKAYDVELLEV